MRSLAGVAGVAAALALSTTAAALEPAAPPVGNFGGGTVVAPPRDPLGAGNTVLGMRAAGGRLQIEATIRGRCGGGTLSARTKLAPDGGFVAKGTSHRHTGPGVRLATTYRITGTLTAGGVQNGRAEATSVIRATGQKTQRCKSGTVAFKVRRPSGVTGMPGAAADARYYGLTSEKRHGARRGIVLRVSSDGRSLTRALYAVTLRCGRRTLPDIVDTPRRNLTIDAQGRVNDSVHYTSRTRVTITRSTERFSATLGSTGATGTLSITDRTTDRESGKLVGTCTTGSVEWTAAP